MTMSSRRPSGLTPLAIVLPHPQLPSRRSSLLSLNSAASPHTPRSCHSPCLPSIYYPANRKSTDSWNSSNGGADEMEFDWKQEQVLLLSRTLDALPAHLVTPFNGPIPPSNLLDKIARGVSQAKGPADWPHSIRATRAKLLELARSRAKEDAMVVQRRQIIAEEVEIDDGMGMATGESSYGYFHDGEDKPLGQGPRRPLYRQSSMDFIKPGPADIKDNAAIARLSNRLQRSDRLFPNPAYHPYSRGPRTTTSPQTPGTPQRTTTTHTRSRRSSSPPLPTDVPSLINPSTSTTSSSTLNSLTSLSTNGANTLAAPRILRRSASTFSTSSMFTNSTSSLEDPRLQRVRHTEYARAGAPVPPPKDSAYTYGQGQYSQYTQNPMAGMKRAPSYGALAQEVRAERVAASASKLADSPPSSAGITPPASATPSTAAMGRTHTRNISGSYPSSDEEEKARTKRAKKVRTRNPSGSGIAPSTPSAPSPPPSDVHSSPGDVVMTAPSSPIVVRVSTPPKEKEKTKPRLKGVATSASASLSSSVPAPAAAPTSPSVVKSPKSSTTKVKSKSSIAAVVSNTSTNTVQAETVASKTSKTRTREATPPTPSRSQTRTRTQAAPETQTTKPPAPRRPAPMNLQRNPSMFGAELPQLHDANPVHSASSSGLMASPPIGIRSVYTRSPSSARVLSPGPLLDIAPQLPVPRMVASRAPMSPEPASPTHSALLSPTSPTPMSPGSPKVKTLRRVRRLAPARRISFGSLVAPTEEDDAQREREARDKACLGSAFQLL